MEHNFVVTENLKDGPPANPEGIRQHEGILFVHPEELPQVLSVWTNMSLTRQVPPDDELVPEIDVSEGGRPRSVESTGGLGRFIQECLESLGRTPDEEEQGEGQT